MSNIRELSQLASVIVVSNDTKNVGIGSTIPSSKLSIVGDAYISGIVTAVEFYGDGSNLTGIATFSGDYTDLSNKPSIPSDTGDLSNNAGFITTSSLVGYATETYVDVAVANLVDSSPSTLDTLNELAAALGDDPNFATTITNSLATKADLSGATFVGIITAPILNVGSAVTITSDGIDTVGIITALGGFNLGISSAGSLITSGPVTKLNFVGTGNTFLVSGTEVDISISGGGGGSGSIGIGSTFPGTPLSSDSDPSNGNLFFHIDYGRVFVYYDEVELGIGSSAFWIDAAPFNMGIDVNTFLTGSASSPSAYFEGDQTTGWFSPGSGQFSIVSIGNTILNVNESGTTITGILTASSFIKSGGTSSQFLKADGSVDSNTYLTSYTESQDLNSVLTFGNTSSLGMSVGVVTCTDINATSDINLKENIVTINDALDIVNDLRGVKFEWRNDGRSSYGVIAQELEEILPELVTDTTPKTVNYNGIIGVLIEGMKEQNKIIQDLQNRIFNLENNLGT